MTVTGGQWPRAIRRFVYDFYSHQRAPSDDGIVRPEVQLPDWIDHVATLPGSLEIAQHAREQAEAGATKAEDKASRLVQVNLALLTITLGLGSYQLGFAQDRAEIWDLTLIPICTALVCLSLSAFEALQIDRVGLYSYPDGSELATATPDETPSLLLGAEVCGRELAAWTSQKKHSDLMQARAWFTRGLAALIVAGLVAGIARAESAASPAPSTNSSLSTPIRIHVNGPFGQCSKTFLYRHSTHVGGTIGLLLGGVGSWGSRCFPRVPSDR